MFRAFKYRIYPNKEQEILISKHFGCVRYIYNQGLETKIRFYEQTGNSLTCNNLITGMLNDFKKDQDKEWLKEVTAQSLQMALRNLDNAFTRFFRSKKGFPKFKSKHNSSQSCQFPQSVKVDFDKKRVVVPKIGGIKTTFSRKFEGKIKTTTISRVSSGKYFVSILVDNEVELPIKAKVEENSTVGIDLGIKDFCIDSNGNKISNPHYLKKSLDRIKCLQRRVSRKVKGSHNRKKAIVKLALKHEYVKNVREDFLHKVSSRLIRENQTICLEDLNVAGMMRNHCLAQSIADVSWSRLVEFLKYKAEWYGKNIIQIGRFEASSKTCSVCGYVKRDLILKDRNWECPDCHARHDRDVNAASNIKKFGLITYHKYCNYNGNKPSTGQELPGEPMEIPISN